MLIDKNGFFWAKCNKTYTRIEQNSISIKKPISQINKELNDYESFTQVDIV
jgi:hypothetical protein